MTCSRIAVSFSLAVALLASQSHPLAAAESASGEAPLLVAAKPPKKGETPKFDLQYKLKRGEVIRYDVSHRASIRSTIDDTTQAAQTKTDSVKVWKVTDTLPNGDIEFINVVDSVKMVNQLPDKDPTEYDSKRDKTPPPGFEDAARAVGVPLSVMRISSRGKIVRRNLKIKGQGAEDDAPIVLRLPDHPVAIGDTWDEPFDVKVMLDNKDSKSIQTRRHHKLADVTDGVATVEVTYQVLSPIDSFIEVQLVQRLMEGEVKFNIKEGRVLAQQMDIDKRILGFAGPTSSMQYIMRMEEKIIPAEPKATAQSERSQPSTRSAARQKKQPSKTRTASRSRSAQSKTGTKSGAKSQRR